MGRIRRERICQTPKKGTKSNVNVAWSKKNQKKKKKSEVDEKSWKWEKLFG
jgi:hypothetical protein